MAIEHNTSQQTSCNATVLVNGVRRQAATAVCAIRPGRGINISVELMPDVPVSEQDTADIVALFADYIAAEFGKAASLGIPVALPAQ